MRQVCGQYRRGRVGEVPQESRAHHIPLRYLHKLFHEEGRTAAGWIRGLRLDCCHRDLADPGSAALPIRANASRWGFCNAAHFSRAFRDAFGLSARVPTAVRNSARRLKCCARVPNDGSCPQRAPSWKRGTHVGHPAVRREDGRLPWQGNGEADTFFNSSRSSR
ncbi:AraC family transcriptional regulator [Streptomyces sp. S3(2020)]|uniref:helix-turn-helix domain-containing protein n=1 Tax=Streptomyces sp. S3(2020) TaxID=2732044 RepID=UPI001487DC74|nr:helix-turn-helix domain-containing protein [Streptomyces sp. S3(2020)]NNN37698.1 AraC family transcriptional regulator [Streptomyces sp. S3(2020)]